jgi:hypothetical protein
VEQQADLWDAPALNDAGKARELINLHGELAALREAAEIAHRDVEHMEEEQVAEELLAAYRILALEADARVRDADQRYREAATQFQDILERYKQVPK